jgi:mercuric transport protein
MNRRRVAIGAVLVFAVALAAGAASAATRTVSLRVKGMTCGGCAVSVENALKGTPGVEEVSVSYEKGLARIKYDDQKVSVAKLREVINSTGFSCDVTQPGAKSTARRAKRRNT